MNEPLKPPLTTTTSIWPAALIMGIAVAILAVFMIINIAANPTVATSTTLPVVVGGLATAPSNAPIAGCQQNGNPPGNISGALQVPVGTVGTAPVLHPNGGAGDYDCLRALSTTANTGSLLGFYRTHLEAMGWSLFSTGTASGEPQLLFQKAGSDTFYWVVGVTVTHASGNAVGWTYRIYQNSSAI